MGRGPRLLVALQHCGLYGRFLPPLFSRWDKADPAAVLLDLLVLPLRKTFDAAFAARGDVTFFAIAFSSITADVNFFTV